MAAKGSVAKEKFIEKISQVFPSDYIGCFDKKYYFWAEENGEKIQLCLSLTCPKVMVGETQPSDSNSLNFDLPSAPATDFTVDERKNIETLMERLGL